MKISKIKALTIATTVIGSASLASVVGVTSVAVLNSQTSEDQSYSQTGNSDNGQGGGNGSTVNPPIDNNKPNDNVNTAQEAEFQKLFTNQKTIEPSEKVFDGLDQIKTIDDLWNFYPKPANIPSNFSIALDSVQITSSTPDSNLGLQVTITINGKLPTTFVIYGFSAYTAQDYKQIFEAANPSGKFTKDGKYFPYLDWNDLSKEPSDPNYLGNYFKPVIPVELSANNIVATPVSFNLSPNNVVNYYYNLHSLDNKISIKASVPVSAYYEYQYPLYTDAYKPVSKTWEPINFDFIKANLPVNYTRADFDSFIWKHWNGSTLADAINAYRYWYLFDESNLTSKLKSYILSTTDYTSIPDKWPIGLLVRGGMNVKNISISPTYDASMNLNSDKSYLKLNWHIFDVLNNFLKLEEYTYKWTGPFRVDAQLNINFDSKKPAALNKDGLVSVPVTLTTDINFGSQKYPNKVYKFSQVVKKSNWNILDALYYYFKIDSFSRSSSSSQYYSTPFFSQFEETLKKIV